MCELKLSAFVVAVHTSVAEMAVVLVGRFVLVLRDTAFLLSSIEGLLLPLSCITCHSHLLT